jgi:hypothetical protein
MVGGRGGGRIRARRRVGRGIRQRQRGGQVGIRRGGKRMLVLVLVVVVGGSRVPSGGSTLSRRGRCACSRMRR